MIAFSASLSSTAGLGGGFAPSVSFSADLTSGSVNYVDFAGNIGGVSFYGKLLYGQNLYSRDPAFVPIFSADLDIVGQNFFDGDLAPVVTFAGALTAAEALAGDLAPVVDFSGALIVGLGVSFDGDLAPVVTFSAELSLDAVLAGELAPQVSLNADLSLDLAFGAILLDGGFYFVINLAASSMISGPLWGSSEPCPSPPWTPSEPCPPSLWTPVEPCDPVEWGERELCNG